MKIKSTVVSAMFFVVFLRFCISVHALRSGWRRSSCSQVCADDLQKLQKLVRFVSVAKRLL
jgi:hypothetical protein